VPGHDDFPARCEKRGQDAPVENLERPVCSMKFEADFISS
jgi:hypothetical protein